MGSTKTESNGNDLGLSLVKTLGVFFPFLSPSTKSLFFLRRFNEFGKSGTDRVSSEVAS